MVTFVNNERRVEPKRDANVGQDGISHFLTLNNSFTKRLPRRNKINFKKLGNLKLYMKIP